MMRSHGFTLLEVLVAVAIFALLGMAAYSGLDAVLKARARLDDENHQWRAVALFWTRLGRDLSAFVERPARLRGSAPQAAFLGEPVAMGEYAAQLELTRLGAADGGNAPPERVAYRLRGGKVEWLRWPALDSGPRAMPDVAVLLERVAALEFSYRDSAGVWNTRWPPAANLGHPTAVKVVLRLESGEALTRWYAY
ncbi:MAG: type II secretion system protein GspJ [Hydrogenophilales bacterium CG_4_9_14_3_um_filter_63_34]|nr:MAG: type II secretion system protein GspJ [Hydrogenophilales bacterium CG_4_10_14_3_um_filter_63_21]PJB04221.1 MAG: type II secretion system protein GspJ [Hydrogenophilales bacterium CG_4_9_14_3_um_filter_63_34]